MRPTTKNREFLLNEKMSIETPELMHALSCGRATAVKIGEQAHAKITIGRRVLWDVKKIEKYLESITAE